MNYHKYVAGFLTANQVVVFSEGLTASDTIKHLNFDKILVISQELNECQKLQQKARYSKYISQRIVYLSAPLVQTDVLTALLDITMFSCIVCLNPDMQSLNVVNELIVICNLPMIAMYDSPLYLVRAQNVCDIRINYNLQIKLEYERLILIPRVEKTISAELHEERSKEVVFEDLDFDFMCQEVYKVIQRYCALGKNEYASYVYKLAFHYFIASPYVFSQLTMPDLMLYLLAELEVSPTADIPKIVTKYQDLIDNTQFEFRNFDFQFARSQLEAVKEVARTRRSTPIMEQLDDFLQNFEDFSVIFPSEQALEAYFYLKQLKTDDTAQFLASTLTVPRIYSARKAISFAPRTFPPFKAEANQVFVVYAPTLAVVRGIEKICGQIGELHIIKTPFLSKISEAAAKFEYAAFSLLRTFRYRHYSRNLLTLRHKVLVDFRETKSAVPLRLKARQMDVVVCQLQSGDYILSAECAVERKSEQDLISSIQDKRLFYYLERMQAAFYVPLLLCEYGEQHRLFEYKEALELMCGAMIKFPRVRVIWAKDAAGQLIGLSYCFGAADFEADDVQPQDGAIYPRFLRSISGIRAAERTRILSKYSSLRELLLDDISGLVTKLGNALADKLDYVFKAKIVETKY